MNLTGGLKAKGHPVGAAGVSMIIIATRQLISKALGYQLKKPKMGLTFNIGGSVASDFAAIFKRIR